MRTSSLIAVNSTFQVYDKQARFLSGDRFSTLVTFLIIIIRYIYQLGASIVRRHAISIFIPICYLYYAFYIPEIGKISNYYGKGVFLI